MAQKTMVQRPMKDDNTAKAEDSTETNDAAEANITTDLEANDGA